VADRCSWCGVGVGLDDGWRAFEPAGARRAAFCRLEHVFPWTFRGAHWDAGDFDEPPELGEGPPRCSQCDAELGEVRIVLVRHRDDARIADAFCSTEHMADWAKSGGRWRSA